MFDIAGFLEAASPWAILTAGLVLILVDMLVTTGFCIGWVGLSVMELGVLDMTGASGMVQLVAFPLLVVGNVFLARPLVQRLPARRRTKETSAEGQDPSGQVGQVVDVLTESPSEGRVHVGSSGDWRARSEDGRPLIGRQRVRIVRREGLVLVVRRDEEDAPNHVT